MPTIANRIRETQEAIESGKFVPVESSASQPYSPTLPAYPSAPNTYLRTPLPPASVQQPDMQRVWQTGTVPQNRISPQPPISNPVAGASSTSQAITVIQQGSAGTSVLLQTNNQNNAVQNKLDLLAGTNVTLSSDSHGGVTINSSASASSIPFLSLKRWALYETLAGSTLTGGNGEQILMDAPNTVSRNAGIAAGGPNGTFGAFSQIQAGSGAGNGFFGYQGDLSFWSDRNPYMLCRAGFNSSSDFAAGTKAVNWLVLADVGVSTLALTTNPTGANLIGFLYDASTSSNWKAAAESGGSLVTHDTGVAADANSHQFEATLNSSTGTVTYAIDGVNVGTIILSLTVHDALRVLIVGSANDSATMNFNIERVYAQSDF